MKPLLHFEVDGDRACWRTPCPVKVHYSADPSRVTCPMCRRYLNISGCQ